MHFENYSPVNLKRKTEHTARHRFACTFRIYNKPAERRSMTGFRFLLVTFVMTKAPIEYKKKQ